MTVSIFSMLIPKQMSIFYQNRDILFVIHNGSIYVLVCM